MARTTAHVADKILVSPGDTVAWIGKFDNSQSSEDTILYATDPSSIFCSNVDLKVFVTESVNQTEPSVEDGLNIVTFGEETIQSFYETLHLAETQYTINVEPRWNSLSSYSAIIIENPSAHADIVTSLVNDLLKAPDAHGPLLCEASDLFKYGLAFVNNTDIDSDGDTTPYTTWTLTALSSNPLDGYSTRALASSEAMLRVTEDAVTVINGSDIEPHNTTTTAPMMWIQSHLPLLYVAVLGVFIQLVQ